MAAVHPLRPSVRRRGPALAAAVTAALLLAGCGGGGVETVASSADLTHATVEPSAPPGPADPVDDGPVDEPVADGPVDDRPVGDGTVAEEPLVEKPVEQYTGGQGSAGQSSDRPAVGTAGSDGTASGSQGPTSGTDGGVVRPPEVTPVHGGQAWAVYLAVGSPLLESEMHVLEDTESHAHQLGYVGSGIGSVSCDQGAAEALGLDPDDNRVAVYFDSAARAQEFVAVYDRQDVGSAQVTTYCSD